MSQLGARLHFHAAAKWPTAAEQRHKRRSKSAQNVSQAASSTRVAPARITYTTPSPRNTRRNGTPEWAGREQIQGCPRNASNPKKSSGQAVHHIPPIAQICFDTQRWGGVTYAEIPHAKHNAKAGQSTARL